MLTGISYADFLVCGESEEDGSVIRHFIEVWKRRDEGKRNIKKPRKGKKMATERLVLSEISHRQIIKSVDEAENERKIVIFFIFL